MRTRSMFRLLPVLGLLLASCSSPETVDTIVAGHVAARGGKERIQALQSMRATGLATSSGGRVARVVREIKRPGRIRVEFTFQGLSSIYAHDGERGWQVAPLMGHFAPEPLPPETAAAAVDQLDIEGPLVDWRAKGHSVELVGRETIGGRETFKLEERLKGGELRFDYIDAETHLLARTDVARTLGGRRVDLETTFADYRPVGGLVFPHLIESRAKGRPQSLRIVVETTELDPDLDEARFRMPG
jgi:hypothetical protein